MMSREWLMPIIVSVGAVVALGLVISAFGLGGLDDVTIRDLAVRRLGRVLDTEAGPVVDGVVR